MTNLTTMVNEHTEDVIVPASKTSDLLKRVSFEVMPGAVSKAEASLATLPAQTAIYPHAVGNGRVRVWGGSQGCVA